MKILEDKAIRGKSIKLPLKYRCPHCDSLLLIEEGDYGVYCPYCKETFELRDYENI